MMKRAILTGFCAALLAGFLAADKATTVDQSKCPLGPMKFMGGAYMSNTYGGSHEMHMTLRAWKGGVAAVGGSATLMGKTASRDGNVYAVDIPDIAIRSGETVTVTFKPPWRGLSTCTGTIAAPPLFRFIWPTHEAHVRVAGPGHLDVRWEGGNPPIKVRVYMVGVEAPIYTRDGVVDSHLPVPLSTFSAGKHYRVKLEDTKRPFRFDPAVDPTSDFQFSQSASQFFYSD